MIGNAPLLLVATGMNLGDLGGDYKILDQDSSFLHQRLVGVMPHSIHHVDWRVENLHPEVSKQLDHPRQVFVIRLVGSDERDLRILGRQLHLLYPERSTWIVPPKHAQLTGVNILNLADEPSHA